jgi:antitoxin (DNA-binding transcriptional repressor) of toxin-antitoxin stability system
MKEISIQDLKARLSATISEAEEGMTIVVTRHRQPVAQLSQVGSGHLHRGRGVGTRGIRPAVRRGTNGRYLEILLEDRGDR